jgi:hypothetical protein
MWASCSTSSSATTTGVRGCDASGARALQARPYRMRTGVITASVGCWGLIAGSACHVCRRGLRVASVPSGGHPPRAAEDVSAQGRTQCTGLLSWAGTPRPCRPNLTGQTAALRPLVVPTRSFAFPCNEWLEPTKEKGVDGCKRTLYTGAAAPGGLTSYRVLVKTSDLRGAGTDADVFLTIYGPQGESAVVSAGRRQAWPCRVSVCLPACRPGLPHDADKRSLSLSDGLSYNPQATRASGCWTTAPTTSSATW